MAYNIFLPKKVTIDTLNDNFNDLETMTSKWYYRTDPLTGIENTPTLDILRPFRFESWISLLPSSDDDDLYIAVIEVRKTSRIHDSNSYSDGINDLCFNAEHLETTLNNLTESLLTSGAIKIEIEPTKIPDDGVVHMQIGNHDEFLVMLMCAVYANMPHIEPSSLEISNEQAILEYNEPAVPIHMVIGHILYNSGFTHDDLQQLLTLYMEKYNRPETDLTFSDETQIKQLISLIPELPLYSEAYDIVLKSKKHFNKHNIESAVIDKRDKQAYPASFGGHYTALTRVIARKYADEFTSMTQEEKDDFIMTNFELVGQYYRTYKSYIPSNIDVEMHHERIQRTK